LPDRKRHHAGPCWKRYVSDRESDLVTERAFVSGALDEWSRARSLRLGRVTTTRQASTVTLDDFNLSIRAVMVIGEHKERVRMWQFRATMANRREIEESGNERQHEDESAG
jgi:hypothetical protein